MNEEIRNALYLEPGAPMAQRTIDITTIGRRSNEQRRIETVFYPIDGEIYLSGIPGPKPRAWLLNLEAHPGFSFHLKHGVTADLPAIAEVITDAATREAIITPIHEEFDRRHGPDSPYPKFPLGDWLANAPLAKVSFPEA